MHKDKQLISLAVVKKKLDIAIKIWLWNVTLRHNKSDKFQYEVLW